MEVFDYPDKFRVEVKEREIQVQEERLKEKEKLEVVKQLTNEERKKKVEEKEEYRKKWVLEFFKELHPEHKKMTEEEYKEYIKRLEDDKTKAGYSIQSFINKENPAPLLKE